MIKARLEQLREQMAIHQLDAYIIPSSDPHQSEYVADYYKARSYFSGFTGSAGTLLVTQTEAGLWTDGRYFIQAEQQLLGSGIQLFKMNEPGVPIMEDWLKQYFTQNQRIGFDGAVYAVQDFKNLKANLPSVNLVSHIDCIQPIWQDRPHLSSAQVFYHDIQYTGKSVAEKLEMVRNEMKQRGTGAYILGALNDIAWLFNIRGNDVLYTPVVYAYALVTMTEATLFIESMKVPAKVKSILETQGVILKDYEAITSVLMDLEITGKVFLDPSKVNVKLYQSIPEHYTILEEQDLTLNLKAIMNSVEIKNQRNAHVKDGIALVKCLHWIENQVKHSMLDEFEVGERLEAFRSEQPLFLESSFDTIAAYGGNGAIMHYSAEKHTAAKLEPRGLFLLDSGGQYLDGTTDTTRTIGLGPLTEEEMRDYTLVLKGHIQLSTAIFLHGTTGSQLDVLARQPIWNAFMDYKSGTGHGVGYLLSVHEGPQRIRKNASPVVLEAGMVITNEPGIYKENKHGIRIENVLLVKELGNNPMGRFMGFEPLTFCPIDTKPVLVEMLTDDEISWLNHYNEEVYKKLSAALAPELKDWLRIQTRPLDKKV